MINEKDLKLKLTNFYKGLNLADETKPIIDRLFVDYRIQLKKLEDSLKEALNNDAKRSLNINREYYDIVSKHSSLYEEFVVKNKKTTRKNIEENNKAKQEIYLQESVLEAESKIIISNSETTARTEINEFEKKLINLIASTKIEIEEAKKTYMINSDMWIKERDSELKALNEDFERQLNDIKKKQQERSKAYETQMLLIRQQREQLVSNNSEEYREIKENHIEFSIFHNSQIDIASDKLRDEQRRLNEEMIEPFNNLKEQINILQQKIETKKAEIEFDIQTKSDYLLVPFQQLKTKYDEDMRACVIDQNDQIQQLENEYKLFESEINKQIRTLTQLYESGDKSNSSKREYNKKVKALNKEKKDNLNLKNQQIREIKLLKQSQFIELTTNFVEKKKILDLEFVEFEYEKLKDKNEFICDHEKQINLINLQIAKLEEDKNYKIWLLNNAYNNEIAYLERILQLGSENQELLVKNQVGENSLLLANNAYHNDLIKTYYLLEAELLQLQSSILNLEHQHDLNEVTSKYQLLIQEEMVKRDSLIKQYEYEVLMEKENLKRHNSEIMSNFEQIKAKTEYELNHQKNENSRQIQQLDYILNLKNIKIDNLTKKQEASIQLQIARAKADRNFKMYKISAEKNDGYYLGLFDILFEYHKKYDAITKLIKISYDHPDFDMATFYHLLDISDTLTRHFMNEMVEILEKFEKMTTEFIDNRIEELTGFKFINKEQELLDRVAANEDLIKEAIEVIEQERRQLVNDLNALDAIILRDTIQISSLYKNIQNLKSKPSTPLIDEELVQLELGLTVLKNYVKSNEKNKRQLEKQILIKDRKIAPLKQELTYSNLLYRYEKRVLTRQMERYARVYYRQKNRNIKQFSLTKEKVKKYCINLTNGIENLKNTLAKNIEAINIQQKRAKRLRDRFINNLHQDFNNFRNINLSLYQSQVKDQQNVVNGFNSSYLRLNKNLNHSYESSFSSEKRKHLNRNKMFDNTKNKLHAEFFYEVDKIAQTATLKENAIDQTMKEYDYLFTKTFDDRTNTIQTIKKNYEELSKNLQENTKTKIDNLKQTYNEFYNKKRLQQKEHSQQQIRLYELTTNRSLTYLDTYLTNKTQLEESLKEFYKENNRLVKNKQQQYKRYLLDYKNEEKQIEHEMRVKLHKNYLKLKNNYNQNINQVEKNTY